MTTLPIGESICLWSCTVSDLECSAAELVYGTTLRIPGDFFRVLSKLSRLGSQRLCAKIAPSHDSSSSHSSTGSNKKAIDELMNSLDTDRSGTVSAQELVVALKGSGIDLEAVQAFIATIDKNGDGQLDRNELRAFFKQMGY
ncbi:hypothetical protein SprV_0301320200 [Sparganum proliferum]